MRQRRRQRRRRRRRGGDRLNWACCGKRRRRRRGAVVVGVRRGRRGRQRRRRRRRPEQPTAHEIALGADDGRLISVTDVSATTTAESARAAATQKRLTDPVARRRGNPSAAETAAVSDHRHRRCGNGAATDRCCRELASGPSTATHSEAFIRLHGHIS